jgi:hypothetical protein
VVGYYNRFDVFDLKVTRRRLLPITIDDATTAPSSKLADTGLTTNEAGGP